MNPSASPCSPRRGGPGTRPVGTQDESEAAFRVRELFSRIAPRYDFLNHLLSFSFDRLWRRRTAQRFRDLLARPEARVLDLCCGTGDLALEFSRLARSAARSHKDGLSGRATIFGSDFAHPMLVLAREKTNRASRSDAALLRPTLYIEADALSLPFPDFSFDLVAAAFGFRNLANYERGLREMHRLLKPGGELGILEFAEPRNSLFAPIYRFYFEKILPRIGGAISGSAAAYAYLPSSVSEFPQPEELSALMTDLGFADVRFELWTAGIVALHTARRP